MEFAETKTYAKGAKVLIEGKSNTYIYFLFKGKLNFFKQKFLIKSVEEQVILGEVSFLTKSSASSTVVVASETATIAEVTLPLLMQLFKNHTDMSIRFFKALVLLYFSALTLGEYTF